MVLVLSNNNIFNKWGLCDSHWTDYMKEEEEQQRRRQQFFFFCAKKKKKKKKKKKYQVIIMMKNNENEYRETNRFLLEYDLQKEK